MRKQFHTASGQITAYEETVDLSEYEIQDAYVSSLRQLAEEELRRFGSPRALTLSTLETAENQLQQLLANEQQRLAEQETTVTDHSRNRDDWGTF